MNMFSTLNALGTTVRLLGVLAWPLTRLVEVAYSNVELTPQERIFFFFLR